MSVIMSKRQVSKAEFVNKAYDLAIQINSFLSSFSRRDEKRNYDTIWPLIQRLVNNVIMINDIYTQTSNLLLLYYRSLLIQESISCCTTTDVWLSIAYDTAIKKEGVEDKSKFPKDSLTLKINKLLEEEIKLLKRVQRSNKEAIAKARNKEPEIEEALQNDDYKPILRNSLIYKNNLICEKENIFYDEQTYRWSDDPL